MDDTINKEISKMLSRYQRKLKNAAIEHTKNQKELRKRWHVNAEYDYKAE